MIKDLWNLIQGRISYSHLFEYYKKQSFTKKYCMSNYSNFFFWQTQNYYYYYYYFVDHLNPTRYLPKTKIIFTKHDKTTWIPKKNISSRIIYKIVNTKRYCKTDIYLFVDGAIRSNTGVHYNFPKCNLKRRQAKTS